MIFRLVPDLTPARMIAILLAPPRIAPDRLQVPAGIGTDPYVPPCRWNDQGSDAVKDCLFANRFAVRPDVLERIRPAKAADAGTCVGGVAKTRFPGGGLSRRAG